MIIQNIKKVSRTYKIDLTGQLFLKNKLKFRFIKNWINLIDENMLKTEKNYFEILEKFEKWKAYYWYLNILKKKNLYKKENIIKFKFKFNVLNIYDFEKKFHEYYKKYKLFYINYFIKYNQNINKKRVNLTKWIFKKKQQFKFFLNLTEKKLKNIILNLKKKKFYILDFYYFLEYRLDMIIYRSFFFPSILIAQKYIKKFGIYVNNNYITKYNLIINIGDKITLQYSYESILYIIYLLTNKFLVLPLSYLEINYSTLTIIIKSFFLFKNKKNYYTLWNKDYYKKSKTRLFNWQPIITKNLKQIYKYKKFLTYNLLKWYNIFNQNFFLNLIISKFKKHKINTNLIRTRLIRYKNLDFIMYQEMFLIYYPFKLNFKEIESIFHLY